MQPEKIINISQQQEPCAKSGPFPSPAARHLSQKLPVFNYHGIQAYGGEYVWEEAERPYVLSAGIFEAGLDQVAAGGFKTIGLEELSLWLQGFPLGKPAMLTFDDGTRSHFDHAAPLMKKKKMTGVFFIPAAWVGKNGYMGWSELKRLLADGFEIGSHGMNHVPLTRLSAGELEDELGRSKKILEDRLGIGILGFSVPRGFYGRRIGKAAQKAGYRFVFTSSFDLNSNGQDPFCLSRLSVRGMTSPEEFSRMLDGKLGIKKYREKIKGIARGVLHPGIYDRLAAMKRKWRHDRGVSS